jgi:glycosyltransferase involved in cell wall biosynthesis
MTLHALQSGQTDERASCLDVSIVIPCYDRLDLLERTLRACLTQIVPADLAFEIIVADNHADQLAAELVERFAETSDVPLRHVPAPARNIALARNCGIAAAAGAFIGFVDDDEAPEPDWLANHYACLQRTRADASFGPKFPEFEGGHAPSWDKQGWFYTVDFGLPADTEIRPLDWWPVRGRGLGTGNSMLRRERCLSGARPFDETYGRTGGEDTLMFFGLARAGRRFVWCPSAKVREFNSAGRMTPDYMRARLNRSARHSAQCRLAVSDHKWLTRVVTVLIGTAQVVVHGVLWVCTRRTKHWLGIGKGTGKLFMGRRLDFVPE